MRFAQILNGKVHWIFEFETQPQFAPNIQIIDITNFDPQPEEGWLWDPVEGRAIPPLKPDTMPEIRKRRNQLLAESDWTQLPDTALTIEQKTAWAVYRQQLRDFPAICDPNNPIWPVPPLN